jgi:hypothetical protein
MSAALALAILSSLGIGVALVTGRIGLRSLDARSGAAISIPTATALFALATPFALDAEGFTVEAALWFALLGVFFPATVTILTFRSNEALGPTITGAVSGATPLSQRRSQPAELHHVDQSTAGIRVYPDFRFHSRRAFRNRLRFVPAL